MLSSDQLSDLIRKRYEIRLTPTLADSVSQGYADGDFGSGVLFDTARGKKAGEFSFSESFGDLDDIMMEIAYRGDVDGQVDSMMREFREGDANSGQGRFNDLVDDLTGQLRSHAYTPDRQIPIIHGSLYGGYRGQGLYRKLILPTMIDYLGDFGLSMGSGRYNRSQAATRAHTALQNKNDPRIRHILEKPYDEDWGNPAMILEMATQGRLNSDDDFLHDQLLEALPDKLHRELSGVRDLSPVDIYQQRFGAKIPGWGDLRLSPRRLPVIEQDWDEYAKTQDWGYSIYDLAERAANRSGMGWDSPTTQQSQLLDFMPISDLLDEGVRKSFPLPEFWHGTSAANAKKILEEGLDPYSFGSPHDEDAVNYAEYHDVPAILGFDTDERHTLLDPHDEGYDFGTSDFGHVIVQERVPPELIRLFAMGHEGISDEDWSDLLRILFASDRLSRNYPDIEEAYASRRVRS